jgi:thiol:disulfide interchange protein
MLLFQSSASTIAISAVVFLAAAVAAIVVFKLLKRTVKMAVRMAIVAVIFIAALVGSIAFMAFNYSSSDNKPTPARTR